MIRLAKFYEVKNHQVLGKMEKQECKHCWRESGQPLLGGKLAFSRILEDVHPR